LAELERRKKYAEMSEEELKRLAENGDKAA
jgi:hypothetical protein